VDQKSFENRNKHGFDFATEFDLVPSLLFGGFGDLSVGRCLIGTRQRRVSSEDETDTPSGDAFPSRLINVSPIAPETVFAESVAGVYNR
jgi:hypothetical protein